MALSKKTIAALAEHLENAQLNTQAVTKITDDYPDMDWDDAYDIQYEIRRRKEERGDKVAGLKMGLTSRAKMRQMGVDTPQYGFISQSGALQENATVDTSAFIHPRIEPEIAFVTRETLRGPGCHIGAVLAATDYVIPAIEVIDSRYKDFKFDLKSVIADNTSAAAFVSGGRMRRVEEVDLRNFGVVVEKNGKVVEVAAGAAVLGHPASSVAMLANLLAKRGEELPAGTFIMTGGLTAAVAVGAGDSIVVRYQDMGSVSLNFA